MNSPDSKEQSENIAPGSLERMVRCSHIESENESDRTSLVGLETPGKHATPKADADVSLPLPQLLGMLSCQSEVTWNDMARTPHERQCLQVLVNLWQSLGRPVSGFWLHTRVFYNRIVDSYNIETPNEKVSDVGTKPSPQSENDSRRSLDRIG